MFGMAMLAGRKAGKRRPANIVLAGFALTTIGIAAIIPLVPRVDSGWYLVIPLLVAGSGLGLLVSQLNNFTLAPIAEERVSEAAGVNSAAGSFGLSFGLAMAGGLMLWTLALSFTHLTNESTVIPPAQQQQIAAELETDAEMMSNTQLQQQIADEPQSHPGRRAGHQHRGPQPIPAVRAPRPSHRRTARAWPTPSGCGACPTSRRSAPATASTSPRRECNVTPGGFRWKVCGCRPRGRASGALADPSCQIWSPRRVMRRAPERV